VKHLPLLTVLALLATGLAAAPASAAPEAVSAVSAANLTGPVSATERTTVRLDGVTVRLRKRTRQVVTVNRTSGHHARVTLWVRVDGKWVRRFRAADGRIGYNGLVAPAKRVQGSGKTPLGTHSLPWAFGMRKQRPKWDPSYRRVRKGDFWVLDNRSKHYNRYRNRSQGGFRWRLPASHPNGSERLKDYPKQYEFSFVTSFNARQVRHRGGAIFLHVNGSGATAGCVSAPRWFLRKLMPRLDQSKVPLIAIGR
jgi:L,D-peptidoglycan transpeptidase YkuD (ErfK/YbiS/YcfS/YnhG family)